MGREVGAAEGTPDCDSLFGVDFLPTDCIERFKHSGAPPLVSTIAPEVVAKMRKKVVD